MYYKKYVFILAAVLLFSCLAGCAAKDRAAEEKFPDYTNSVFAGPYLECLGEYRENVEKTLKFSDETWDWLTTTDGGNGPRPSLKEPVNIDGEDYTLYLRFTEGPEMDSPSYLGYYYYERTIESNDAEVKNASIRALYELLASEFGEPEEPDVSLLFQETAPGEYERLPSEHPLYTTVREGFENGHSTNTCEKWVLAEHVDAFRDLEEAKGKNILLLATLSVNYSPKSVTETVTFRLLESSYSELARYTEEREARYLEEHLANK